MNVSRARRSLLIVGHAGAFCSNPNWRRVADHLEEKAAIGPNLPLLCPRHPSSRGFLARSAAEVPVSPAARPCRLPCAAALLCGHLCPSDRCHSDAAHAAERCHVPVALPPERAACGHPPRAECWEFAAAAPGLPTCKARCTVKMPCGHGCPGTCHAGKDVDHRAAMHKCAALVAHRYECGHVVNLPCRDVNAVSTGLPPCREPCASMLPEPCGHPCVRECGALCSASSDDGGCLACAKIKEIERAANVKAREAEALFSIEAAMKLAKSVVAGTGYMLKEGGAEYVRVVEQLQRSVQPGHGMGIRVDRVDRLANVDLERAHYAAVSEMKDASLRPTQLFHGTSAKNADSIAATGFLVNRERRRAGASHAQNMLGAAVYLCPDSSKAARAEYLGGTTGVLLVCDVLLGSTKEVVSADPELDVPARRLAERYDSAMMRRTTEARKTGVIYDEYAVYDPRLVLPRYKITVEVVAGAPAAAPTVAFLPGKDGARFYDIKFEDVMANARSAEAYHFSLAQTLFSQLSTGGAGGAFAGKRLAKVTYCANPRLEALFNKAKETFERRGIGCKERYLFHGTDVVNIPLIQEGGFKLPGVEIPVAVGTSYGRGIYLGLTPDESFKYARGKMMLLVKVLSGVNKKDPLDVTECHRGANFFFPVEEGRVQSYEPNNRMLIVASAAQTLPCYVVHWE